MQSPRALALLGLAVVACDSRSPAPTARKPEPVEVAAGPRVCLLSTAPGARESELRFQSIGATTPAAVSARLSHVADADVRGVVLPGREVVLAIADAERAREPSFSAWLFRLESGQPTRTLATGCFHASRPLLGARGRVFVERGSAGPEPDAEAAKRGELRVDALEVDEVDPDSGALRALHTWSGYTTHLAAAVDLELILYRVGPSHADLVAVNVETGDVRVLRPEIPPFARDFSLDESAHALVYANHDHAGWLVVRLDLASGAETTLARSEGMWVAPHAWPGGGVLLNGREGSNVLGGRGISRPLGGGFDEVAEVSADHAWVGLLHSVPGQFPTPFVTEVETGKISVVATPPRTRTSIAGFAP